MVELGDITAVWSWPAFILPAVFGFFFGVVLARITSRPRWRTSNSPRAYAWLIGVLAAWFLFGISAIDTIGALIAHDPGWLRVVSRFFPHAMAAPAVGLGVLIGLRGKSK